MVLGTSKSRVVAAALFMVIGAGLLFAPLLSLTFCVKHGPGHVDRATVPGEIPGEDIATILGLVRGHEDFGRALDVMDPRRISVLDYIFTYDRVGMLSIEPCRSREDCVAQIHVGFTCGGLCGGGEIFCARMDGDQWEVDFCGTWAS